MMSKSFSLLLGFVIFIFSLQVVVALEMTVDIPITYQETLAGENIWFLVNFEHDFEEKTTVDMLYQVIYDDVVVNEREEQIDAYLDSSFTGFVGVPADLEGAAILRVAVKTSDDTHFYENNFLIVSELMKDQETIANSLFDIVLTIPEEFREVEAGDDVLSSIKLINLGSDGRVDVFLDFWIEDEEENTVLKRKETVAVETQANFVRDFKLPESSDVGMYTLGAQITYADGKYAVSHQSFEVTKNIDYFGMGSGVLKGLGIVLVASVFVAMVIRSRPSKKLRDQKKIKSQVSSIVKNRMKKL